MFISRVNEVTNKLFLKQKFEKLLILKVNFTYILYRLLFFFYINAVVFTRETINYYENCILNTYYL